MSNTTYEGWTNKETYIIHHYFSDWYEDYCRDGVYDNMETFVKAWVRDMRAWLVDDSGRAGAAAMIEAFMDHVNWAELDAMYPTYSKEEA